MKEVPPVDAEKFEFLFTLAMEASIADNDDAVESVFERVDEAFMLRFKACAELVCLPEIDDQMKAVRLAASFPLMEDGSFDQHAFFAKLESD